MFWDAGPLAGGIGGPTYALSELRWCVHAIAALVSALATGSCLPGAKLQCSADKQS